MKNQMIFYAVCMTLVMVLTISAAPQAIPEDASARTVNFVNENGPNAYNFAFNTDNGISRDETGVLENVQEDGSGILKVSGSFSYTLPNGQTYLVKYTADENGFQPKTSFVTASFTEIEL